MLVNACNFLFYYRKNINEVVETSKVQIMPQSSTESSSTKLKKKRPERQLYVPPAQRRLPLNTEEIPYNSEKYNNVKNGEVIDIKKETYSKTTNKNALNEIEKDHSKLRNKQCSVESKSKLGSKGELPELVTNNEKCQIIDSEKQICLDYLYSINYICILWHYQVDKSCPLVGHCFKFPIFDGRKQLPLYSRFQLNVLHILHKNFVLWQPKLNTFSKCDKTSSNSLRTYPLYDFEEVPLMVS